MWGVVSFWVVTVCSADPATDFRRHLSPFVLYDFLDASESDNYFLSSVQDLAAHPTVKFGDLVLNPNRTLWQQGAPGISLKADLSSLIPSSALVSAHTWQASWQSLFQVGFVIEIWVQSSQWDVNGDFVSLAREITRAGTTSDSLVCNSTEPLFIFRNQGPSQEYDFEYARQPSSNGTRQQCVYNEASEVRPQADTLAFFIKVLPNAPSMSLYALKDQQTTGSAEEHPFVGNVLGWGSVGFGSNTSLRFLHSNRYTNFEYNILSFAIYPSLTEQTIFSLGAMGLPNARPYAKSFKRSVPENNRSLIHFCVNNATVSRDSDCLDYTNTWQISPIMTLTPSSNLKVFIISLPQQGSLYQQNKLLTIADLPFSLNNNNIQQQPQQQQLQLQQQQQTNTIEYRPPSGVTSWYVSAWTSARGYEWAKNDLTSFQYMVQDAQGANSTPGLISLEVYPQHSAPNASDITRSDVYAGKPMNIIELAPHSSSDGTPVITEFLRPSATASSCQGLIVSLCVNSKDRADLAYATVKTLPTIGTLYTKVEGEYVPAKVGTQFLPSLDSCQPPCVPSIYVYYNSTLRSDYNEPVTFTYTVTTRFENLQLNSTRYDVDDTPFVGPEPIVFAPLMESNVAVVTLRVKDGLYAVDGNSVVKQTTATQPISLSAQDVTSSASSLVAVVTSLPTFGTLFQASGQPITPSNLPAVVSGNLSLLYLPNITHTTTYTDRFTFVARSSAQRQSPSATQTIQVLDVNDAPVIVLPLNRLHFSRNGNPQTWEDVGAANDLFINFTDPDPPAPLEPFYHITLSSPGDFTIFMSEDSWTALRPKYVGSLLTGALTSSGGPGAGSPTWDFVATRELALQVLNPVRMRPNKITTSAPFTITVQDCVFAAGYTDPRFSGPDWTSLSNTVTVSLSGDFGKDSGPDTYLGIADMRVVYTVYGVIAFIALLLCSVCIFCARCLYRKYHQPSPEQVPPAHETEVLIHDARPPPKIEPPSPPVRIHRPRT